MVITEPFATGDSIFHKTDPRFRVMAAVAYSVLIAVCGGFEVLAAAFGFSLGMVALARLKTGLLLKRWILVNGFMLM